MSIAEQGARVLLLGVGAGLVVAAAALSTAEIEEALRGTDTGALSWGPLFFRALLALHGALLAGVALRSLRRRSPPVAAGSAAPVFHRPVRPGVWGGVLGLTALAFVLRLWKLETSLWIDEVLTLVDCVRPPLGTIITSFPSQNQHLLYSVAAHLSVAALGESAFALRLPAVIFGAVSIPALFLLARRLTGTPEALAASALLTVSYHHVWFSQNARGYTAILFFATLSTWLWIEALDRERRAWWLAYAGSLALGMGFHLTMAFVAGAHFATYLALVAVAGWRQARLGAVRARQNAPAEHRLSWMPLAAFLLAGTLTLQLYALALPAFLERALHEVSLESRWTDPWWLVLETLRSLSTGFAGSFLALAGLALLGAGFAGILRRHWVAALSMVLPGLALAGVMIALGHNLWPRFFFFAAGFAVLLAVHGATQVARCLLRAFVKGAAARAAGSWAAAAGWALLLAGSLAALPRSYAHPKQDFLGAREYLEDRARPGDAIVAVGLAGMVYERYYAPQWTLARTAADLESALRSHRRVWLVYTMPHHVQAYHPDIWKVLERDFETTKTFPGTLGDGQIYVCRERSAESGPARAVPAVPAVPETSP